MREWGWRQRQAHARTNYAFIFHSVPLRCQRCKGRSQRRCHRRRQHVLLLLFVFCLCGASPLPQLPLPCLFFFLSLFVACAYCIFIYNDIRTCVCVCTRSCIDSRSETSMTSHSQTHTQSKTELVSRSLVYNTHIQTQTCIEYINARMYLYRKKGQTANSLRKAKYKQSGREQLINSAACARSFNVSLCACMCEYERGSSRCKSFPLKTSRSQSSAAHSLLGLSRELSLSLFLAHARVGNYCCLAANSC